MHGRGAGEMGVVLLVGSDRAFRGNLFGVCCLHLTVCILEPIHSQFAILLILVVYSRSQLVQSWLVSRFEEFNSTRVDHPHQHLCVVVC